MDYYLIHFPDYFGVIWSDCSGFTGLKTSKFILSSKGLEINSLVYSLHKVMTRCLVYVYLRFVIKIVHVRLSIDPVILIIMSGFKQASMGKIKRLLLVFRDLNLMKNTD